MEIISKELTNELWDMFYDDFKFDPGVQDDDKDWISVPYENKTFKPNVIWTGQQEALINSFFEELIDGNIFALDWQHDCFVFSPNDYEKLVKEYYDEARDCNVYFPNYYPNGDYHFFVDPNWRFGFFGHPWLKQIAVFGEDLIEHINMNAKTLGLSFMENNGDN